MARILIRNFRDETLDKLKSLEKEHKRSLQQELHDILERSSAISPSEVAMKAAAIREKLEKKGRRFSDSTDLLRKDRER